MRTAAIALACAACGGDIRLGGLPDATPDSLQLIGPFVAGRYTVTFHEPAVASCQDSLLGQEAAFETLNRASVNLVDGIVQLGGENDQLVVSGTPITTAFSVANVTLAHEPEADPPTIWAGVVPSSGTGPLGTTLILIGLGLDSATATSPTGIQGTFVHAYETADQNGACVVAFGALVVSN